MESDGAAGLGGREVAEVREDGGHAGEGDPELTVPVGCRAAAGLHQLLAAGDDDAGGQLVLSQTVQELHQFLPEEMCKFGASILVLQLKTES